MPGDVALLVAAVADVHSPRYLDEFSGSLSECKRPDLFLFAGDMIGSRNASEYGRVVDAIESQFGTGVPLVACSGNEEGQHERRDIERSLGQRVRFLDDESLSIEVGRTRLGIVGVSTMVAEPAGSEAQGMESIGAAFDKRIECLSRLLKALARSSTHIILLMHYSPLAEDRLTGEPSETFSWWVSKCVKAAKPNLVVHGHLHRTNRLETIIHGTRVMNVAYPASRKVTMLTL